MFCTNCGASNLDDSSFCTKCGTPLNAPAASSSNAGEPPPLPSQRAAATSTGRNADGDIPDGVKGWSWGAFLLNWIWAIGNRTWWGLLAIIPYVGVIVAIWLGLKGREMAWKNRRWDSLEHFNRVQRKWSQWGVGIVIAALVIGIAAGVGIPAYQHYRERVQEAALPAQEQAEGSAAAAPAALEPAPATLPRPAPPHTAMLSRGDFQDMVTGQSPEGIIARLGKPDETQEISGMHMWYYHERTVDPVTQNVDSTAQIMFENGMVLQVSFM
jgi:zinc-ribbon domain